MTSVSEHHTPSTATAITPFSFEGAPVRVVTRDGDPWFILADVCRALALSNPSKAAQPLDDEEKSTLTLSEGGNINGLGMAGAMPILISEAGLYTLILRCRDAIKPGTVPHRFRRWVTSEVLPSIRKTGSYVAPAAASLPAEARQAIADLKSDVATLARKVDNLIVEHHNGAVAMTGFMSALDILKDHDVPPRKRRGFSQRVSRQLRFYCDRLNKPGVRYKDVATARHMFQVDVVRDWLKIGGKAMIVEHKAAIAGQTALKFGRGRAGENVVPMNPAS